MKRWVRKGIFRVIKALVLSNLKLRGMAYAKRFLIRKLT